MLLEQITLRNLLSFKDTTIDLGPLNILIGENTAGKSNLIEAVNLLQAAPTEMRNVLLRGGGIQYWLWLGDGMPGRIATLACRAEGSTYQMEFSEDAGGFVILSETLSGESGEAWFTRTGQSVDIGSARGYPVDRAVSVFASYKIPADETPTTRLGRLFSAIRIYREFQTGPRSGSRYGVSTNSSGEYLLEGGDNLALVLHELDFHEVLETVRGYLTRLSDRITGVKVRLDQGTAGLWLQERGLSRALPSARMSDGTLKFLCLLAVLLHPDPPPLVCIEEPEQGLHPDAIQIVAQALRDASERMQLIVTTHSQALVDAFSSTPECVLVCERGLDGGTQCERLSSERLRHWLVDYKLGELWRKGEIGGNRW
jgi:predicted ATPase